MSFFAVALCAITAALLLALAALKPKVVLSFVGLGLAAFCSYGLLACFELASAEALKWQISYGSIGFCSLILAFAPWLMPARTQAS